MPETNPGAPSKIKPETDKSKERIQESLDVFNELLASSPDLTLNTRGFIEAKIELLQEELDENALQVEERDIEQSIEQFQKAMAREAAAVTLRNEIKFLYNKELFPEALEKLKQLIQQNGADNFCVIAVMGCMLRQHSKKNLGAAVERFISEVFKESKNGALFKTMLAKKMIKKGYAEHARLLQQK